MPRYPVATVLNEKEHNTLLEACKKTNKTKYALVKRAILKECGECLNVNRKGKESSLGSGNERIGNHKDESSNDGKSVIPKTLDLFETRTHL